MKYNSTKKRLTLTEKKDLLQITNTYNEDTFQALLDEFYIWDKKINRENASEKSSIVEERTGNIVNAYNNIIEYSSFSMNVLSLLLFLVLFG